MGRTLPVAAIPPIVLPRRVAVLPIKFVHVHALAVDAALVLRLRVGARLRRQGHILEEAEPGEDPVPRARARAGAVGAVGDDINATSFTTLLSAQIAKR